MAAGLRRYYGETYQQYLHENPHGTPPRLSTERLVLLVCRTPAAYLHEQGLAVSVTRASSSELDLAHRLRAGLRQALEERHDGIGAEPSGLAAILEQLDISLTYDVRGPALTTSAAGVAGGLARIGLAADAMATAGLWGRLKICSSDECGWAYYDHSKNRSRSWCEYGCGNKVKTRSYRARRRTARAAEVGVPESPTANRGK